MWMANSSVGPPTVAPIVEAGEPDDAPSSSTVVDLPEATSPYVHQQGRRSAIKAITDSNRYAITKISPAFMPVGPIWGSRPSTVLANPDTRFMSAESEAAALASDASPAWCETEMIPFVFQNVTTGDWGREWGGDGEGQRCRPDRPVRIGNFSTPVDLLLHQRFPVVDVRRDLDAVTAADLGRYWADYPHGHTPRCYPCKGTLLHNALYTLRRWFKFERWLVGSDPSRGNIFTVDAKFIVVYGQSANFEPAEGISDVQLSTDTITGLNAVQQQGRRRREGTWYLLITTSAGPQHTVELRDAALRSFLRSITYLHPKLAKLVRVYDPTGAVEARSKQLLADEEVVVRSQGMVVGANNKAPVPDAVVGPSSLSQALKLKLPSSDGGVWKRGVLEGVLLPSPGEPWPYQPCSSFDVVKLVKEADRLGNMGYRREFWPYKCDAIRESKCGQEDEVARRRKGLEGVPLRVAVALAGFIRSFPKARAVIYDNLVKTTNATVFVATWNVVGRVKKTDPVTKKNLLRMDQIEQNVAQWMHLDARSNRSDFIKILNYKQHLGMTNDHMKHGFPHGGLYFCQSQVLRLVRSYQEKKGGAFDVLIRTRMDIYPVAPLYITRIWKHGAGGEADVGKLVVGGTLPADLKSKVEYVLDMGASCKLDEVWWPQYAVFEEGKLLKSYQDTRFKFFGWQVCDWIEIGTVDTALRLEGIFDFMVDNYVFGIAQWLDHAFYVHNRIAYQVVNPFLKIMRHGASFFG